VAFDITKSLSTQVLPKAEASGLVDKAAPLRTPFKPEKHNAPTRSFQEELASEPAKATQPKKDIDTKAAPIKKAVDSGAEAATASKQTNGPKTEHVDLRLNEAVPVGNQPLEGVTDNSIQDILQSPVAALLAGNLQSLSPEELMNLIGKNELLSTVLFGADSEAVLEQLDQPTDILESLNLSPEFLEELKNTTGEADLQKISAMQVFAALGFDKTAVIDQINDLRAQLSGQKPLVITGEEQLFAQANLNAPVKKDSLNLGKVTGTIKTEVRSLGRGVPSDGRGVPSDLPTIDEGLFESVALTEAEKNVNPAEVQGPAPQVVSKNFVEVSTAGKAVVDTVSTEARSPLDQFDVFKQWKDSANQSLVVPAQVGEQLTNVSPDQVVAGAAPRGKTATFDGFFELGKKIDQLSPENVTAVDGKQVVTQKTATEAVRAPNFMDAVIGRFGVNMIQGNDGLKAPVSPLGTATTSATLPTNPLTETITLPEVKEAKVDIQSPKEMMNFGAQLAAANSSAPKPQVDQSVRKMTVDEFMGDVTAGRINFDFNKPESDSFQGSSEEQESLPFTGDKLVGALAGTESKTPAFGLEFGALMEKPDLATGMTSSQRAELTQKVMDSANYLVREGAGSVKLDLSTADLGTLQIAISLSDNKVDIKVFTESDPVREAMIADLSRLKDALQTQNVNLNQVQVGVGERFGNSSSFDQSQQFSKHQEFRETFAENMKQSAARAFRELDVRDITPPSIMNRINQISSDGRVQIRV
jgi:hypothetical protein